MNIKKYIKDVVNFPKEGIIFKDIQPLLMNPKAFNFVIDWMCSQIEECDVIVAPDARGFIFATPIAIKLGKPFIMIRKPNKLPGSVSSQEYETEYGKGFLEIQDNVLKPNAKVVIIDDLLAKGGTVEAITNLVKAHKAQVVKSIFVIDLIDLHKQKKINNIVSLIQY